MVMITSLGEGVVTVASKRSASEHSIWRLLRACEARLALLHVCHSGTTDSSRNEHGLRRGASGGRVVDAVPVRAKERRGACHVTLTRIVDTRTDPALRSFPQRRESRLFSCSLGP